MSLVVVADIFGKTKCLEELVNSFSSKYNQIEIISPYDYSDLNFKNERQAYNCFQQMIGLNGYIEKVTKLLKDRQHSDLNLLGFSVGASAIWAVSERLNISSEIKAKCFYGSQIRNFLHIQPKFKTELFFSKSEPCFDVVEAIAVLTQKANVTCYRTDYHHGFMNKKSENFNSNGYLKYLAILNNAQQYA